MIFTWCTHVYQRHYSQTEIQHASALEIDVACNERFSFQVVMRLEAEERHRVRVDVEGPDGWPITVRRVGYVPVRHLNTPIMTSALDVEGAGVVPGYVPDPLFEENEWLLPTGETHAFWITVAPADPLPPGRHELTVTITPEDGRVQTHTVPVTVYNIVLQKRRDFSITHWVYIDALMDWYKTDHFDDRFWGLLSKYIQNVAGHGLDTLYVPFFTPPLDGIKRPSQLLHISRQGSGTYHFDWSDVERYVLLARSHGITHFEWTHLFTQWGVKNALRIYENQGREEVLLWPPETGATSEIYRSFLSRFLPQLHQFLTAHDLLDHSFFHVSDEPHGEEHLANYRAARALLQELAPWMKVMDALTEIKFAEQKLTDMPIPSITTALDFDKADIPSWCYYCCGPRGSYLNRLMDTPLSKIAMHGMLFYRWPFRGFLHWGYNYWYECGKRNLIDPYAEQDALAWYRGWAYGDPFVVYPGPDGPIDSIRWEVFGESLQDYALLQTLGIDRNDPRLQDIQSFENFPKAAEWRLALRKQILQKRM